MATAPARDALLGEVAPLVAGRPVETGDTVAVDSPYDGAPVAVVHRAGPKEVEAAIAAAVEAFETTRRLASHERAAVLERVSAAIAATTSPARSRSRRASR
jgi:acyl-CoA reductase-like NAD-dependent aldehyde dehydrogenase